MSSNSRMKKITLEKLEDSSSRVKSAKTKQIIILVVAGLGLGLGGFFVYGMLSGPTIASRFIVNNMTCPACVITVKEVTAKMPGVVETEVSLASQSVTVKFQENRTSPETIGQAIAHVGYQVKLDGAYKSNLSEDKTVVIAGVNGKPLFISDIGMPLAVDPEEVRKRDISESFFSNVGKEIILQAADQAVIVAQPQEIEDEIRNIFERQLLKQEEFTRWIHDSFGSMEKFNQVIAQRLAIQKFLDDLAIPDIQDQEAKKHNILELLGKFLKDADVKIYDSKMKEAIHARVGHDDWKTFWPRMISADTEIKSLLMGRSFNTGGQVASEKTVQD